MPNYAKTILISIVVVVVVDYLRVLLVNNDDSKGIEPLIVNPGETDTLEAGIVHKFSSVTIHKGATLRLIGTNKAYSKLIIENNFRLFGRIVVGNINIGDNNVIISETYPLPDNGSLTLDHQYTSFNAGGKGGTGGRPTECHRSSCQRLDCFNGEAGVAKQGGYGSRGMSETEVSLCKNDRSCKDEFCYQNDQSESGTKNKPSKECYPCGFVNKNGTKAIKRKTAASPLGYGNGGDGGKMGNHGGLLYIQIGGFFDGKGGSIDLSGGNGKNGKDGESDKYTGGGGGGGGPGGNGGKLMIMVHGDYTLLPAMNVAGGKGGKGGKGGVPHKSYGLAGYQGKPGKDGSPGKAGKAMKYNKTLNRWDKVK